MGHQKRAVEESRQAKREARKAKEDKWAKATWEGPLDFYVTTKQWDELDALIESGECNLAEWITDCCEAGLKFSVVQSKDDSFVATVYAAYANHEFAGCSVSAFSDSAIDAMQSLWFKHAYLGQGDFAVIDQLASQVKRSKRR